MRTSLIILFIALSVVYSAYIRNTLLDNHEEYFTSLYSGTDYYFLLNSVFDDKFKIKVKLQSNYSKSYLSLYSFQHDSYDDKMPSYGGELLNPSSTIKNGFLILEKTTDISDIYYYSTLVVRPSKYINYIYVKLHSENETVSNLVLLAVVIPLSICGVIILIAVISICCCRSKRVVINQTIPPKYDPIQPPVVQVQPIAYQQPSVQMQYIPPTTQPNAQYIPPPY